MKWLFDNNHIRKIETRVLRNYKTNINFVINLFLHAFCVLRNSVIWVSQCLQGEYAWSPSMQIQSSLSAHPTRIWTLIPKVIEVIIRVWRAHFFESTDKEKKKTDSSLTQMMSTHSLKHHPSLIVSPLGKIAGIQFLPFSFTLYQGKV